MLARAGRAFEMRWQNRGSVALDCRGPSTRSRLLARMGSTRMGPTVVSFESWRREGPLPADPWGDVDMSGCDESRIASGVDAADGLRAALNGCDRIGDTLATPQ